mgnify:CR=1 FL=1
MHPSNPLYTEAVLSAQNLSKTLKRLVPSYRGTFNFTVTNEGDFHMELMHADGAEGAYSPNHHDLRETLLFVITDPDIAPTGINRLQN